MSTYELIALLYAEEHGIIEYHVKGNKMIFYTSFPNEGTLKAIVDLDTLREVRTCLKNYYPAYISKIGGCYEANYCV